MAVTSKVRCCTLAAVPNFFDVPGQVPNMEIMNKKNLIQTKNSKMIKNFKIQNKQNRFLQILCRRVMLKQRKSN